MDEAGQPQAGVVVVLFTDIVRSTELLDRLGDDAAEALRRTHFSLLRDAVSAARGREVKSLGDGLMVAFASPSDALRCAVAMQQAVVDHNQGAEHPLAIRIGLHAGEPMKDGEDLHGTSVVVSKRLCDRAHGGEILTSQLVAELIGIPGWVQVPAVGAVGVEGARSADVRCAAGMGAS